MGEGYHTHARKLTVERQSRSAHERPCPGMGADDGPGHTKTPVHEHQGLQVSVLERTPTHARES
jgi:hypothetical protein